MENTQNDHFNNIRKISMHFDDKHAFFSRTPSENTILENPCSLVSNGAAALNVSNMEKLKHRNSPSVVVLNYFP